MDMTITAIYIPKMDKVVMRITHDDHYIDVCLDQLHAESISSDIAHAIEIMREYRKSQYGTIDNVVPISSHPKYNSSHVKDTPNSRPPDSPFSS